MDQKKLMTIKEMSQYLGVGLTKCRELIRGKNGFGIMIGNKWYADKEKLDLWIDGQTH